MRTPLTPETLRAKRKARGLTQQQLADLMGTTQVTVARWETGHHPINQGWARLALEVYDLRAQISLVTM